MEFNLFISWSGERSFAIAQALKKWIPSVIQEANPWVSEEDMRKGSRWILEITNRLEKSKLGILCLTPENLEAPWIHFEAGAIGKTLKGTYVCPYLYELEKAEIMGPLSQFMASKADKEDTRRLTKTINSALGVNLKEDLLDRTFDRWWPDLDDELKKIGDIPAEKKKIKRGTNDMLEEILELVRDIARQPDEDMAEYAYLTRSDLPLTTLDSASTLDIYPGDFSAGYPKKRVKKSISPKKSK
jgi:hypothetical protein